MSAMSIVISALLAAGPVTALVGTRVRPINLATTDAPPAIYVNIISGSDEPLLAGAGKYYRHRMQVSCIATTGTAALDLGEAVMAALEGVICATIANCKDVNILFAGVDMTDYDDDLTTFRRMLQFDVWWRKT